MQNIDVIQILEMPDEQVHVDLLSDEEVEGIMKAKFISNCASVGFSTSLQGACCCAQVDASCSDGLTDPESTCLTPIPTCV